MSLTKNLTLAQLGVKYTNQMLSHGASNKWWDQLQTLGANSSRVSDMRAMKGKFSGMGGLAANAKPEVQELPQIRWIAKVAKASNVGNCGECASVAFVFLHDIHRVTRLDFMHFNKPGDHAWVVIGRAQNSKTSDYRTWGSDAVVCDPWGKVAFPGHQLPSELPSYAKYSKYGYASILVTG